MTDPAPPSEAHEGAAAARLAKTRTAYANVLRRLADQVESGRKRVAGGSVDNDHVEILDPESGEVVEAVLVGQTWTFRFEINRAPQEAT